MKTHKPAVGSWMYFIEKVKEISKMSLTHDDYHDMMKFYILGKLPEDFVNKEK